MRIEIRKSDYATGFPWCPYKGGFWYNLLKGDMSTIFAFKYRIDIYL